MTDQKVKKRAIKVIRGEFSKRGIGVKKLFLFGSRARGEARPDSDWDFLAVTGRDLKFTEKWELIDSIQRVFARDHILTDIVVKSARRLEREKDDTGHLAYYISREVMAV